MSNLSDREVVQFIKMPLQATNNNAAKSHLAGSPEHPSIRKSLSRPQQITDDCAGKMLQAGERSENNGERNLICIRHLVHRLDRDMDLNPVTSPQTKVCLDAAE